MLVLRVSIAFLLIFASDIHTSAQSTIPILEGSAAYTIDRYTDENGLPQNSVKAIAPDPKGFLWLATEGGLVRFDGRTFFAYDKTKLKITDNRIRYFLPQTGRGDMKEPHFYARNGANAYIGIGEDAYATTIDSYPWKETIDQYSNTNNVHASYMVSLPDIFGLKDIDTLSVMNLGFLPVGNNRYYLRRNGTISLYEGNKPLFNTYFPHARGIFFADNRLFATDRNGRLFCIDKRGADKWTIRGDIARENGISGKNARPTFFWNNISQQVFIYQGDALYEARVVNGMMLTVLLTRGLHLDQHGVVSVFMDKHRNVFLGSLTEGLYMLKKKRFEVLTAPQDSAGNVYYATAKAGENMLITRRGFLFDINAGVALPGQRRWVSSHLWNPFFLAADRGGNIWTCETISPVRRRLAKYSSDGKRFLGGCEVPGSVDGVYCDFYGLIWFQTDEGKLFYLPPESKEPFQPVLFTTLRAHAGVVEVVQSFYRNGNALWLGNSDGLFRLDLKTKNLTSIDGLRGKNVRHIYGRGEALWICTYGDGLYLYRNSGITHFPTDKNRFLLSAHCIVADKDDHFWVPTNKGLFEIAETDLIRYADAKSESVFYNYFDKRSGFNTNEFNGGCQPCGLNWKSGNISFPSMNGIVYFDPSKMDKELPDRDIIFKEMIVDGKPVSITDNLTVPRDFEQIGLSVSTAYYGSHENVTLEYRIVQKSKITSWIPVADADDIYLTGLAPGNYKLEIRKVDGFGPPHIRHISLHINVLKYWYETDWFIAVLILLAGCVYFMVLRARISHLRRKNYERNLLTNARLYGNIITSINHDIQTPMHYVIFAQERINKFLAEQNSSELLTLGNEARLSLQRITTLTNNLLNYLRVNIYRYDNPIGTSEIPLYAFVNEMLDMFAAKIARHQVTINNTIPVNYKCVLNEQLFSVIVHNLIDNALKVSAKGHIHFELDIHTDFQTLVISDSGKGMPNNIAAWLMDAGGSFDNIYLSPDDSAAEASTGLGLILVKDLCKSLGITLKVVAGRGTGSQIRLTFPRSRMP